MILADDHTLVRAGIRALLEDLAAILVVAEAGDGYEVLRLIDIHQPDVVVMDIVMPGLNGVEATACVTKDFPKTRVIILSVFVSEEYVLRALHAGAVGYLSKDAGPAELEIAIRAVVRGETYISPAVSKYLVADYLRRGDDFQTSLERLTPRQREILQLIAEGHTAKEIAQMLDLSPKTVESHRAQVMERLDIHDIAGLVRYAIRMGLLRPDM